MHQHLTSFLILCLLTSFAYGQSANERLHALFDRAWDRTMRESPTWASSLGDHRFDDQWPDLSDAAHAASLAADQALLKALEEVPRAELSDADQLHRDLFELNLTRSIEGSTYPGRLLPITHMGGIQTAFETGQRIRFEQEADYENWIRRLKSFGVYMDQTLALLRKGVDAKVVHPKIVIERALSQVQKQIVDDPKQSPFLSPFRKWPNHISEARRIELAQQAEAVVAQTVVPAFKRLKELLEKTVLPAAPEDPGLWQYAQGAAWYAHRAAASTTTTLSPDAIHQIGLDEVTRLRAEMQAIMRKLKFEGGYRAFLDHLKQDPARHFDSAETLLRDYRALGKRVDPLMTRLFGVLPRAPYGIEPIPAQTAPDAPAAYYLQPAPDGTRPGTFFVNTHAPQTRPRFTATALLLHEAVPGHHLQIALTQELDELPRFRRHGGYTAYIEGWGLYSEWLGVELGLYENPYDDFGRLTFELWRAVRLVVDTGIHHKHWTRQQSIDFMLSLLAQSEDEIANEVDRYSVWPGQALAYKIGQLKLLELRRQAEKKLGKHFDVRRFHDKVLEAGPLPLNLLEQRVHTWVNEQQARSQP